MNDTLLTTKDKSRDYRQIYYDGFIIIKPHFLEHYDEITKELRMRDFTIIEAERKRLTLDEAKELYVMHKNKDFFDELIHYMSSDDSIGMAVLSPFSDRDTAIEAVNDIKDKYRKRYSTDSIHNVIHSSDSYDNVLREAAIYFHDLPLFSKNQ